MNLDLNLKFVEISMNNFCELSCVGCPSLDPKAQYKNEIDIDILKAKLSKFKIDYILLCGNSGEPMAHSRIDDFLSYLVKNHTNAKIQVSTNGERLFDSLKDETLALIKNKVIFQVSLDGPNQEVHTLTRKGGSFESVINNLKELDKHAMNFEVVYSRHLDNERYCQETAQLIQTLFNKSILFRDTTIIKENLRPPLKMSQNGNVSVLYSADQKFKNYAPDLEKLYIDTNGDCYPCVSFSKYKTKLKAPNILEDKSLLIFLMELNQFKKSFCECFQKEGDLRQCSLNCGIYPKFKYDDIKDIG